MPLSLKDEKIKAYVISFVVPGWLDEMGGEYDKDLDTCALINDPNQGPKIEWRNEILWYNDEST